MKCFIYRNLHKPGYTYSVKALEGEYKGRVIAYGQSLLVKNVEFVVSEASRQRVLSTGRKNVHAGIVGDIIEAVDLIPRLDNTIASGSAYVSVYLPCKTIKYNPYRSATFYDAATREPIHTAPYVGVYGPVIEAYDSITCPDQKSSRTAQKGFGSSENY